MNRTEIQTQIRDFLMTNFLFDPSATLSDDDSLLENGVVDSTGMLEVIQFVEATYDLHIDDMEVVPENLDSINNLTAFITRKQAEAAVAAA